MVAAAEPSLSESKLGKLLRILGEEIGIWRLAYWLPSVLLRLLPDGTGGRLRSIIYRMLGLHVRTRTRIMGTITFGVPGKISSRLRIGSECYINMHLYVDAGAPVTLGNRVYIGHHVVIVTTNHAIGSPMLRAGAWTVSPVRIEDGAWIGARATLLPGVTVGAGAVVAAGALVAKDVPANTLVGGVPARIIRHLDA